MHRSPRSRRIHEAVHSRQDHGGEPRRQGGPDQAARVPEPGGEVPGAQVPADADARQARPVLRVPDQQQEDRRDVLHNGRVIGRLCFGWQRERLVFVIL